MKGALDQGAGVAARGSTDNGRDKVNPPFPQDFDNEQRKQ